MITHDGWLDWAERVPGPSDKVYGVENAAIGYIAHSAVGFYGGWASRLFSNERLPNGDYTAYAAASAHGWIAYDGGVRQHYPFRASCWTNGSRYPNTHFINFENEGGFRPVDEPLTEPQVAANLRIIRELAAWRAWPSFRRPADAHDTSANLYEHRECVRWGSAPTACPSGRIPWARLLAELSPPALEQPAVGTYAVAPGDTIASVAARFAIGWNDLITLNEDLLYDPTLLVPGRALQVPVPHREPELYVVQRGDTLFALARRWGTTVDALVAANALADARLIRVGQTLRRA